MGERKTGKALKKIGYFIITFSPSSTMCLHALGLISQLVGSQEAPWSPVQLRELHLYKMGRGDVVCRLFFTSVWVQNGSCTPTLCVTAQKASRTEKQVSNWRDKSNHQLIQLHMA